MQHMLAGVEPTAAGTTHDWGRSVTYSPRARPEHSKEENEKNTTENQSVCAMRLAS